MFSVNSAHKDTWKKWVAHDLERIVINPVTGETVYGSRLPHPWNMPVDEITVDDNSSRIAPIVGARFKAIDLSRYLDRHLSHPL